MHQRATKLVFGMPSRNRAPESGKTTPHPGERPMLAVHRRPWRIPVDDMIVKPVVNMAGDFGIERVHRIHQAQRAEYLLVPTWQPPGERNFRVRNMGLTALPNAATRCPAASKRLSYARLGVFVQVALQRGYLLIIDITESPPAGMNRAGPSSPD